MVVHSGVFSLLLLTLGAFQSYLLALHAAFPALVFELEAIIVLLLPVAPVSLQMAEQPFAESCSRNADWYIDVAITIARLEQEREKRAAAAAAAAAATTDAKWPFKLLSTTRGCLPIVLDGWSEPLRTGCTIELDP